MTNSPARQIVTSTDEALQTIREALGRLRYGTITLTVHDAKIVQLDITEKRRFTA